MRAFGTLLKIGANSVAKLTSISGPSLEADTIDETNMESADRYREFVQGVRDAGEVSIEGIAKFDDTNGQVALLGLFNSGVITEFTILFPTETGASWTFNGIVTGIEFSAEMEDSITFSATMKITGKPTLGVTASTGMSALVLSGTGAALSPSFAIGKFNYSHTFNTSTSITVTPTAAAHTIKVYVDGVFIETVPSGSASSAIAFSAAESKKIDVIVNESGKTAKTYTIISVRTS